MNASFGMTKSFPVLALCPLHLRTFPVVPLLFQAYPLLASEILFEDSALLSLDGDNFVLFLYYFTFVFFFLLVALMFYVVIRSYSLLNTISTMSRRTVLMTREFMASSISQVRP